MSRRSANPERLALCKALAAELGVSLRCVERNRLADLSPEVRAVMAGQIRTVCERRRNGVKLKKASLAIPSEVTE